MYRFVRQVPWLLLVVGILLLFGAVIAQPVTSDDIWNGPDSDMIARIPIQDATTTAANEATSTAMEAEEEWFSREAAKTPVVKPDSYTPPIMPTITPDLRPPRIIDHSLELSGWGSVYRITNNQWVGRVNEQQVSVQAGSLVDDRLRVIWREPQQGVVIVWVWPPPGSEDNPLITDYLTPSRAGIVHITAFTGTCLTLVADSATFQFDVAARSWACTGP